MPKISSRAHARWRPAIWCFLLVGNVCPGLADTNPAPSLYTAYTSLGPLQTATTNTTTVKGAGFVGGSVVLVNGAAVSTTYNSSGMLTANIPVAGTATGSVSITVRSPAPGGGTSSAFWLKIATDHIQLLAYTADGTNTGTVRLERTAQLATKVTGTPQHAVTWKVSGAGSISSSGSYQAPATMPTSSQVTVTATLATNSAVSASYSFALIFPQPSLHSAFTATGPLLTAVTNSTTVKGDSFVPQTKVLVNGSAVATTFQSSSTLIAQVAVGAAATGEMGFSVRNPSPGGTTSPVYNLAIAPLTVHVAAFSAAGPNPSNSRLGLQTQFNAGVTGSGNPAVSMPMQWSVSGGGSISSSGLYTAPTGMPGSTQVVVRASLQANASISGSYGMSLLNPVPVVTRTTPTHLTPGSRTVVTVGGRGFVPGTTLQVNGAAVPVAFLSGNALQATIQVNSGQSGGLSLAAENPDPGGGGSASFTLPIQSGSTISAQIGSTPGHHVPDDFLGFSYEWGNEKGFEGIPASGINRIYREMVANLRSGHSAPLSVRIGGGSSNTSGEPNSNTLPAYISMAQGMNVKFILGVNLAADNLQLMKDQARYFTENMPSGSIAGIEIGNEADNFWLWGARPPSYTVPDFLAEFATFGGAVTSVIPSSIGLVGPSFGDPKSDKNYFSTFESEENNVKIATVHGYVGDASGGQTFTPEYFLQENVASYRPNLNAPFAVVAHANSQIFRVDEVNSIDHGGIDGVSNTICAALWAVDTMFEYANLGIDGLNWHGTSNCPYCLYTFGVTYGAQGVSFALQNVNPLYYGMLLFQMATQHGARLLPVTVGSGPNVKVWATEDWDGNVRVVILNKDLNFAGNVSVSLTGFGSAQALRFVVPNYTSTRGVAFGGQSFDGSLKGSFTGTHDTEDIYGSGGIYSVPVQPASAVLLTFNN